MSVELNHTIVHTRDKEEAAAFYAGLLGLPPATPTAPFLSLALANGATLLFADYLSGPAEQHYAFLVDLPRFEAILGRITAAGLDYWADPGHQEPGAIGVRDGARTVYWEDPTGHDLEILTRSPH